MMISPVISSPSSLCFLFLPRHLFSAPLSSLSSQRRKTSEISELERLCVLRWTSFFVKKSISFLVV